jgi:hypothetical protein
VVPRPLSPKQRHQWIVAILGIGVGLNLLIRVVSSSEIGDLVESLVGLGCLLSVAWLIGFGPFRKVRRPVSTQDKPTRQHSSPYDESPIDQLDRLGHRWWAGEISDADFDAEKRRILSL